MVLESSRRTDETKLNKLTKSTSVAKPDSVPKSSASQIAKASAAQALSSSAPKLAASPKQKAALKPDTQQATTAAKPVAESKDKLATVAKADVIPDKPSSGKAAATKKDPQARKNEETRKVEQSRKDEQSGKERHGRQSSGAAKLAGQKRRERSPARSVSPKRKAPSPPSRTAGEICTTCLSVRHEKASKLRVGKASTLNGSWPAMFSLKECVLPAVLCCDVDSLSMPAAHLACLDGVSSMASLHRALAWCTAVVGTCFHTTVQQAKNQHLSMVAQAAVLVQHPGAWMCHHSARLPSETLSSAKSKAAHNTGNPFA